MPYLIAGQRGRGFTVEKSGGISKIESFRFQPVLRSGDIIIRLGQDDTAGNDQGES